MMVREMAARALAALTALTLTAGFAPAAATAASGTTTNYVLATRQVDAIAAGEFDGQLRLQIGAGGIVNGTFMNTEGEMSTVIGGLDGTKIWLELGHANPTGVRNYNGTFSNGKLTASASRGLHIWTLTGEPAKL